MNKSEEEIQNYYKSVALNWKIESRTLMLKYEKDEKAFEEILHSVVGKGGGGVLRNISKDLFPKFSKYIFNNLSSIKDGNFDIFSVEKFPDKQPVSFVSKICHILNPRSYPLIFDSRVKRALGITGNNNIKEKWNNKIAEIKIKHSDKKSDKEIYELDFSYWLKGDPNITK